MAMVGFSFIELLIALLMGGSPLDLPLSLPPLPADATMSQVAPEDCLWYLSWAGCAKANPASTNRTEQLIAEPEVQRFISELEARLRDAIKRGAPQGPGPQAAQGAVLAEEGPKLVKFLITRPTALFVEQASVTPAGPFVKGGAVISAGNQAAELKQSIDRVAAIAFPGLKGQAGELRLPMPQGAPPVELRWHKNYLVVGVGGGSADEIIKRFGGKQPAWLAELRNDLPLERPAMVHYINIRRAAGIAIPFIGLDGVRTMNVLGLDRLNYYASVSGLEGTGAVSRSRLAMEGKPAGIFALLEAEPLQPSDLTAIPKDATFAIAARFDAGNALKRLMELLGQLDPGAHQQFKNELAAIEKQFDFKISEDVLQSIGDTWCLYNSPGEGGLLFTGLTAVAPVKNRERLIKAHDKLLASIRAVNEQFARLQTDNGSRGMRRGVEISDFEFGGHTVYLVSFIGETVPFAPSWCITDKELIVSPFPQMIKARLARGKSAGSLADVPEVGQCFGSKKQPSAVFYQDTRSVFRLVYPVLHAFAAMICNQLQGERVDIDISLLPSMAAIEPHLQPGVSALFMTSNGMRWETRQTMPAMGSTPLFFVMGAFFGFATSGPRIGAAQPGPGLFDLDELTPAAAQRAKSINNLKQIGLAMHNHLDTHRHFPVVDGAGTDGKPRLSWRVHLLPFLEEQALFQQFRLDEPWNSEHNKQLIDKMPAVYRTPGSTLNAKNMTNYVAIKGDNAMFPAGKKIGPADILDGFSNTAMVLEVSDEQAVLWTKPDDFEPDKDAPLKGVIGLRDGKFLVLFADGSVRTLPATTSKEAVQAMFTRNGGETVELAK
jgi:hypothetical protein